MGSKPIPPYTDNFMAKIIDKAIQILAKKFNRDGEDAMKILKRFLDDIFTIFVGTTRELHRLLDEINKIHPNINLTMKHTYVPGEKEEDKCQCEEKTSVPFLDTLCSIIDGRIDTDLFKKPTDRNQYLLPSSCHPKQTTMAIPKSLGLRIV